MACLQAMSRLQHIPHSSGNLSFGSCVLAIERGPLSTAGRPVAPQSLTLRADQPRSTFHPMTSAIIKSASFILCTLFAGAIGTSAWAGNGTILQSFSGASGPGYKPCPDTTGAVGPHHVVDFADSFFIVHE